MSVETINLAARLAFLDDGSVVPITNLFDAWGDETLDVETAISFVCGSGGCWISDHIDRFQPTTIH